VLAALLVCACGRSSSPPSPSSSSPPAQTSTSIPAPPVAPSLQPLPADATSLLPALPGDELVAAKVAYGVRVLATRCVAAANLSAAAQQDADALVRAGWQHVTSRNGDVDAERPPDRIQIIVVGLPDGPCALPGHYRATAVLTRPSV